MNTRQPITACLALVLLAGGCSTAPRSFSASVQPLGPLSSETRNGALSFTACDQMVRGGRKSGFASAAASTAAAGATMFAGAAGVAASGTVGLGATAGGAVLSAAVPVVGLIAGFGVNRLIRSGHERKYKRAMTDCMREFGYGVIEWSRAPKKQPGTATLIPAVDPVTETGPEPAPPPTAVASESPVTASPPT